MGLFSHAVVLGLLGVVLDRCGLDRCGLNRCGLNLGRTIRVGRFALDYLVLTGRSLYAFAPVWFAQALFGPGLG